MSDPSDVLPCIVCGYVCESSAPVGYENQPYGGTVFHTEGHYGSTVFDPMDGSFIEITICDQCLVIARDQERVLWSRTKKPVVCDHTLVGWTKAMRPLTQWRGDENRDEGEEVLHVDLEEVGSDLFPEIDWIPSGVEWAEHKLASEKP